MRTKTAQDTAILTNAGHVARVEVDVRNAANSAEHTLHSMPFVGDMVVSVEHSVSADEHATARVRVQRQHGRFNLGPLAGNASNPLATSASAPVLDKGRRIIIRARAQPLDSAASNSLGSLIEVFRGYVDEVDDGDPDVIELICSDSTSLARDTFIEWERAYGLCTGVYATKGAYVWRNYGDAKQLVVGDLVVPSKLNANGHFYRVTAKVSAQGVAEPVWPTGGGSTVVSGGVTLTESGATSSTGIAVETLMQQILDDNSVSLTLRTPGGSPGWVVRPYIQQRESVLSALETLSSQLGWCLEYKWGTAFSQFDLALFAPDRSAVSSARTFAVDEYDVTSMGASTSEVRNVVRVVYGDRSSRDGEGLKTRLVVVVEDATSIAKYGRRFMEIAEAETSQIDTSTEANALAAAVLADLKEPSMPVAVEVGVDPFLETGDMITVEADGLRFSSNLTLACHSITNTYAASGTRSELGLRGQPTAGVTAWLELDAGRVGEETHLLSAAAVKPSVTKTFTSIVGGQRLALAGEAEDGAAPAEQFEVHLSDVAGFTPSASTLKGSGQSSLFEVADLVPGKTYYTQLIPYSYNASRKVYGAPSVEQSFVAGRAKTGHYDSTSTQSHLPLNGNFEHASDDLTAAPPDHWRVVTHPAEATETWGSGGSVFHGTDSSKGRYVELMAHASKRGNLVSSAFEIRRGCRAFNIYLSVMRTGSSAVSGKDLIVDVSLYADSALSTLVRSDSIFLSGDSAGSYPSLSTWYDAVIDYGAGYGALPTNANFMVIALRRGTTGDSSFAWRVGDVYAQEADFYRAQLDQSAWFGVTFSSGDWSNYGAPWQTCQYMKDSMGFVHLRGLCQRTAGATTTILTLPSGYRPSNSESFIVNATNAAGALEVQSDGDVVLSFGTATYVSLAGITFKAA